MFYKVRWTIELYFKQLKSILNIHESEVKKNEFRLQCEVIGKCIVAMFVSFCYSITRSTLWNNNNIEISIEKLVKYLKRNIPSFVCLLIETTFKKAINFLKSQIIKIINTCRKDRQKSRKNLLDRLIDSDIFIKYIQVKVDVNCP